MWFIDRFLPLVCALAVFALLELIIRSPRLIYALAPLILIFVFLSLWQLTGRKSRNGKLWRFLIAPFIFILGGLLCLSFLEGFYLRQFLSLIIAGLLGIFLEMVYLWLHARPKYQPHALENISAHLNLLAVFLIASGAYSLIIFINFPFWPLTLIFAFLILLLTYQLCWVENILFPSSGPYLAVSILATTEVFLAVSFLPTSAYVSALIVALVYYLITGLLRNLFLGIKEKSVIRRYLLISLIVFLAIMATAKWF